MEGGTGSSGPAGDFQPSSPFPLRTKPYLALRYTVIVVAIMECSDDPIISRTSASGSHFLLQLKVCHYSGELQHPLESSPGTSVPQPSPGWSPLNRFGRPHPGAWHLQSHPTLKLETRWLSAPGLPVLPLNLGHSPVDLLSSSPRPTPLPPSLPVTGQKAGKLQIPDRS